MPQPLRSVLRRIAEILITAAFIGFIVWSVASRWSEVRGVIGDLSIPALALSGVAALAAIWCSFLSWRAILADFGSKVPVSGGMRIFFVGQLAKYLPGKVWPVVTQARLGREYQVPGRASAAAVLLTMAITLGTGLLLTAITLPVLGGGAFDRYWWTLLVLPVAAIALWPPLLNRALAYAMRLARREPMPQPLTLGGIGRSVGWAVATWLCYGVHLWALLVDLGGEGPDLIIRSVGAFAGSWAIGFLLSVAPAGLGPREVALAGLLGVTVSESAALVAAVVSRLLMTVADLTWPAIAVLAERRRKRLAKVASGHPADPTAEAETADRSEPPTDRSEPPTGRPEQSIGRSEPRAATGREALRTTDGAG